MKKQQYSSDRMLTIVSCLVLLLLTLFGNNNGNDDNQRHEGTTASSLFYVAGYPTGAGRCNGGSNAVGTPHSFPFLGKKVNSTSLADKKIKVYIGSLLLPTNGTIVKVPYNQTLRLLVKGYQMRGILVRVEAPKGVDTANVLTPGTGLKISNRCTKPVVGITHSFNTARNAYKGSTIKFNKSTANVILDVSVVFVNNPFRAVHSYGRIKVDFTAK